MKTKEIILKIEFENHKLEFRIDYENAADKYIAEVIIKESLNAVDKLIGKRANNAMNSFRIKQEAMKGGKKDGN